MIWKDEVVLNKVEEIVGRLRQEKERKPALASTLALHGDLLAARAQFKPAEMQTRLGEEEAKALLGQGIPLLRGDELKLDGLLELAEHICQISVRHRPDLTNQLGQIRDSLLSPSFTLIVEKYLACKGSAEGEEFNELLSFILNNALHPFLENYAQVVKGLIDGNAWYRGYCPVCGGEPDFAYLAQETGGRWLVCSRCDTEWAYRRLGCPFCENKDSKSLGYYPREDNVYRLYICDACGRYLKTLDLREIGKKPSLPMERILTMEMDLAARQMGYR